MHPNSLVTGARIAGAISHNTGLVVSLGPSHVASLAIRRLSGSSHWCGGAECVQWRQGAGRHFQVRIGFGVITDKWSAHKESEE